MAKQIEFYSPPQGISRWLYRMPINLYRLGLGPILGKKFLLLNHTGRKSGLPRQAVLEVVLHENAANTFIVSAGFGPKTQWYQNLLAQPDAAIQVGKRKWDVRAEVLSKEASGETFRDFAKGNKAAAVYAKALGFEVDGTEDDYYDMGTQMIFVALRPR